MVPKKHEPKPDPETKSDEDDERTEISSEYRGLKIVAKIGRRGDVLLWMLAWAVFILSTLIGATIVINLLNKLGVVGCVFGTSTYLVVCASAYWQRSLWP